MIQVSERSSILDKNRKLYHRNAYQPKLEAF